MRKKDAIRYLAIEYHLKYGHRMGWCATKALSEVESLWLETKKLDVDSPGDQVVECSLGDVQGTVVGEKPKRKRGRPPKQTVQ